jgi:hypothetical protein
VGDLTVHDKPTRAFQVFDDMLIGFLDMHAREVSNLVGEAASFIDGIGWQSASAYDTCFEGNIVVLLTEGWSLVDKTNTIGSCHIVRI